jgi:hypothetical protein
MITSKQKLTPMLIDRFVLCVKLSPRVRAFEKCMVMTFFPLRSKQHETNSGHTYSSKAFQWYQECDKRYYVFPMVPRAPQEMLWLSNGTKSGGRDTMVQEISK